MMTVSTDAYIRQQPSIRLRVDSMMTVSTDAYIRQQPSIRVRVDSMMTLTLTYIYVNSPLSGLQWIEKDAGRFLTAGHVTAST